MKRERVANAEYVEIGKDKFFSSKYLGEKYNQTSNNIVRNAKRLGIKSYMLNNALFIKDDVRFEKKQAKANGFSSHPKNRMKQMNYTTLVAEVQKLTNEVKFLNQQNVQIQNILSKVLGIEEYEEILHFMTLTLQERKEALASYTHRLDVKETKTT